MDIFDFAIDMEKQRQADYLQLAGQTANKGLMKIYKLLADEEAKHYRIVERMKSHTPQELSSTDILTRAKNIFKQIKISAEDFEIGIDVGQISTYKKAQEIEKKEREFYLRKSDEVKDEGQKRIFIRLADEEKRHYFLLDNIIEFVSRPARWLENAEWYHLDEY